MKIMGQPHREVCKLCLIAQARVAPNVGCNKPFDPRESR